MNNTSDGQKLPGHPESTSQAMSQTVGTILFTLRVAARVESSAVYLLQHSEGLY